MIILKSSLIILLIMLLQKKIKEENKGKTKLQFFPFVFLIFII